ncbi:MAG: tetratricopeptide repeat protein [Candidatus Omnitrophica bacterium]|nr:tetratricopeptide repeat protein [Candidatus Omnitrophota bacterium]
MKKLTFALILFCAFSSVLCGLAYPQEQAKEEEALFVAQKAVDDGFYDVGLSLLERFLKNYPASSKTTDASLLIGQCYFYQGRYLDALKKFEELQNLPQASGIKDAVLYWTAEVHFRGNNFSKAASFYKMIIDDFPKSTYLPSAYYSMGWCLFQDGKFEEALNYFKAVEEKFPKETQVQDAYFKIIECLYNLKDYPAMKEKIKSYLKLYSKDVSKIPYLYFYQAEADYYLNNFTESLDSYSKALAKTKDEKLQALARLGIGWSYLKEKLYKQAEDAFSEVKADNLEKRNQDALLLAKAVLNFETKKYTQAEEIYNQLMNSTTDTAVQVQACLGKADSLYNLGEYQEAEIVYKEALAKITVDFPSGEITDKLHYGLAWALFKQAEFKDAIKEFQKIAKQSEDKVVKVSALCQIGDAYQDSGEYDKAQETYDSILKDYPDSLYGDYVQYQLGLTMLKSSNYDGAILSFLSLKRNYPNSKMLDEANYALGLAYFQKQDYNSSREIFGRFEQDFKESNLKSQANYLLGTSLYNLGKYQEAIEVFKNILRNFSQDSDLCQKAEYEIADCFYQMGDEKEAMSRFKALRTKYPDSKLTVEIIWWLGEYYYRHNDLNLAGRYFNSVIQDFPKSSLVNDAYYILGSIYEQESKYEDSLNCFTKVIGSGKSDLSGQAAIAIADIYLKQDKPEAAYNAYQDVLKNYPNLNYLAFPKIADYLYSAKKYDEAVDYYRKSLDIVPAKDIAYIQFKIAETRQSQGKPKDAVEEYLKVSYLYPENSALVVKSLLRVGKIYEDQEDYKRAFDMYQKVSAMDVPEAKFARENMEQIKKYIK